MADIDIFSVQPHHIFFVAIVVIQYSFMESQKVEKLQ